MLYSAVHPMKYFESDVMWVSIGGIQIDCKISLTVNKV